MTRRWPGNYVRRSGSTSFRIERVLGVYQER